jgi:hypothetical protein
MRASAAAANRRTNAVADPSGDACSTRVVTWALALLCLVCPLGAAGEAAASIKVAGDARDAALRVDSSGFAEVDWTTTGGERRSAVISPSGSVTYGARLAGGDVSAPVTTSVPFAVAVRRTTDGALWALQSWRRLLHGPVELRFARWRGDPTRLTLRAVCCKWGGENIQGEATFQGRPIYGQHSTLEGVPLDPFGRNVYLDSYRAAGWTRMMGILTNRPTGSFSLWIRSYWQGTRYRGAIIGPNWGWTLAPDAAAEARSAHGVSREGSSPPAQPGSTDHQGNQGKRPGDRGGRKG